MKIHVEIFIASRILEKNQGLFTPRDLVTFIESEFHDTRHGIQIHATAGCVANAPLNFPTAYNYTWREEHGTYRTFRPGHDQPAPGRENMATQPQMDDVPVQYRHLLGQNTAPAGAARTARPQEQVERAKAAPEAPANPGNTQPASHSRSHRSSASFGKRQEYIAVAELLRRGHDVYMTLVDDQQIDCVIRQEKGGQLRYLDIQIKARSIDAQNPALFAALVVRYPRENFFYIFYSETVNTYWIVPSKELIEEANQNKGGKNKGKHSINFVNAKSKNRKPRPRFTKYENAFHLLDWN